MDNSQAEPTPPLEDGDTVQDQNSDDKDVFLSENDTQADVQNNEITPTTDAFLDANKPIQELPAEQLVTEDSQPMAPLPKKSHRKLIIILVIVLVLLLTGGSAAAYFLVFKDDPPATDTSQETTQSSLKVETEAIGTPVVEEKPTGQWQYIEPVFLDLNVTWQKPTGTNLRGFYNNEIEYTEELKNDSSIFEYNPEAPAKNYVKYYLAGTFNGGEIIYVNRPVDSMGGSVDVFMVEGGKVTQLERYNNLWVQEEAPTNEEYTYQDPVSGTVNKDTKTIIKGTWAPDKLVINGQNMKVPTYSNPDGGTYGYWQGAFQPDKYVDPAAEEKLVKTVAEGKIYEITRAKDGYKLSVFELELPNYFRLSYVLDGEISNAEIQPITWSDGSRNTFSFSNFGYGCGGGSYNLVADLTANDLVKIGTSDGGQPIYTFKDMTQKVAAQILSEVNARDDKWIEEGKDPAFTSEEFINVKAAIIVQDGMDRWVVFKNSRNFISGGCAKPVVYLYPEVPTTLNVQVGANVTISKPFYEQNGWQNVTALPNGQLLYHGLSYDSLFWEGYGHGTYPDKSSEGVVVARDSVITTMKLHLTQQGFNQKESDDFIAFWTNNIPNKPYVRLTWLSNQEMNTLAPLYLSVKPDTIIRTFLEMEGLDSPKALRAQKFTAPIRKGFTVTEWGGLAVNGLQNLTYEN